MNQFPSAAICVVCRRRATIYGIPPLCGWKTTDGFRIHWPTCGHGKYVVCPECVEQKDPGCPQCDCAEEYT